MAESEKKPPEKPAKTNYQALVEASALGFMFPAAIGIGYLWGWGLDKWLGTRPWFSVVFTVFGVIAAFLNLFRLARRGDGPGEK